jgi:hypothetical protein
VQGKLSLLLQDPTPDGKLKKQLKNWTPRGGPRRVCAAAQPKVADQGRTVGRHAHGASRHPVAGPNRSEVVTQLPLEKTGL